MDFYNKFLCLFNSFILDLFRGEGGSSGGSGDVEGQANKVLQEFYKIGKIVIPVVLGVGAILIIIRLILLGVKLAQNGDDPERRSRIVKGMIWWGVGLGIIIVAIAVSATVLTILTGNENLPDGSW